MKTKRVFLIIAGIVNTAVGGIITFFGLLMVLFKRVLRTMLEESYEIVQNYINAMVAEDESYAYLQDYSKTEAINYVMGVINIVCLIFILFGIINLVFGIFNLLLSKRDSVVLKSKKYMGVLLIVFSWLLMPLNAFNILTTIAICIKLKEDKNTPTKLYSVLDS